MTLCPRPTASATCPVRVGLGGRQTRGDMAGLDLDALIEAGRLQRPVEVHHLADTRGQCLLQ